MTESLDSKAAQRRRVVYVFLTQGFAGLLLMAGVSLWRYPQTISIIDRLSPNATILIAIFVAFSASLSLLKFELTNVIFISLAMMAYMSMLPLLGTVITSWLAVAVAIAARLVGMRQIGPVKIPMDDAPVEYVKTFGLFGTYGIPVVVAGLVYDAIGGHTPVLHATALAASQIAVSCVMLILTNQVVMSRVQKSGYNYPLSKILHLDFVDSSIYIVTIPCAIVIALAYSTIGWGAVLALAFTGVVANYVARNLATTRTHSLQQLQRIASLTNIGKTISLRYTTDQLLMAIYTECKKVIDCTLFAIALLDDSTNELSFELDMRDGAMLAKERLPVGPGLNSWVVTNHQPLIIGSVADETRLGLKAVADSKPTESWLGVPMIARDRVIGVISVESFRKHAFDQDDVILLTAIANQAAVAIENQQLYKDLEGLTYALEQRVMERTNELREANLRLMAADRSKNQFLANMSHELRTPLNSIIGFSSVLLEGARASLAPRFYKFLENIHTAGNHLLDLINDILDLSKIEAGKMELRADTFDLHDTVTAVERVMKGFASEARVQIVSHVADDVPTVCLDEGRLKQILFNLLSNAVKFSPQGGPVSIRVGFIARAASPLGVDTVRIDVSDQGVGIPPDDLQRIFDEFYQTEQGRRSRKGGTGLGLSLTRNFVELHRGTIEVDSTPGHGSTFTLYLPADYNEAKTAQVIPMLHAARRASSI
ncbi:MAG TPA: ATP-binding protein [Thermoanaerobaculia bacterium]|nr:ATP-binding protein [Thermoanaerobaculia bacterium]